MKLRLTAIAIALAPLPLLLTSPNSACSQSRTWDRAPDGTIVGKDYYDQYGARRHGPMLDCYDCDPRKRRDNNTWSPRRRQLEPPSHQWNPNTGRWERN